MPFQVLSPHFYLLDHQHQIGPANGNGGRIFIIKRRKGKHPVFKPFVVDNQPAMLQVQYFHNCSRTVHEDERLSAAYIPFHHRGNNTAQGIKTFPHINPAGVEVILKFVMKMKHGLIV